MSAVQDQRVSVPLISISGRDSHGRQIIGGTWSMNCWDTFSGSRGSGFIDGIDAERVTDGLAWSYQLLARYPLVARALRQAIARAHQFDGYAEIRRGIEGVQVFGAISTYYTDRWK